MRFTMKATILAVSAATTLLAAPVMAQGLPNVIKIGYAGPLTGAQAVTGVTAKAMIEMAVKEINTAGGIAGKHLELVIADDQGDPARASSEAKRLINNEKVHFILGPGSASPALAAAPDITRAKLLSFPFTGATSINLQNYPYGFGTFYSSDAFSRAMFDYAVDVLKAKRVAAMVDTGAQGQAAVAEMKAHAAKRGMQLVAAESFDYDAPDLSPFALNLRKANPDVILHVASNGDSVGRLYRDTEQLGWKPIIVSQVAALFPAQIMKIAGDGIYASGRVHGPTFKTLTMCKGDDPNKNLYVQFLKRIRAFTPDANKMALGLVPIYYDAVFLAKAAIEATKTVDGPTLTTWIEQNSKKASGVGGPFGASRDYHLIWDASAIGFVTRPDQPDPSGALPRAGC